ncbi:hypothetical protein OO013_16135 [Mangrovivirga sp. M17]|uniref:DUF4488 domain-containing protein n=1 Tax=Mangrovivirga halotolerans TaxID=2993936 RepID=A0ABT3RUF9_9BACT|nr:hypothetical protein [Mangrovivirga halotolerans]MCX2745409.1 hypothetical protein [Mangrovivirga halotolerans]
MKIIFTFCFLLTLSINTNGQTDSTLKYTFNEENVVASAIDGVWKSKKSGLKITFKKDTTVLAIIPKKHYDFLNNKVIYHAGYMTIENQGGKKINTLFVLTEHHGNPYLIYYKDSRGIPYGNPDSLILFTVTGEEKKDDKLFLWGDRNYEPFVEYMRIE